MISSIIQLVAIALLCYAIYRESKQDRLSELRKKEELQDLFKTQQSFISQELGKNYLYFGKALDGLIPSIQSIVEATSCRFESIQSIQSTLSELIALKPLLQDLITAQTQNEVKKGEANRTLRRRIQEKDAVIASTRQTLKTQSDKIAKLDLEIFSLRSQLSDSRQAANDGFEYFAEELAAIRAWMNDRGIPSKPLEKHLSLHFKGQVPSSVFQRLKNEGKLFSALGETISQLGDAALKMASSAPKPSVPHTDGSLNAANS